MRLLICTEGEGATKWRGRALGLAASFADNLGEHKLSRDFAAAALEIAKAQDDKYQVAYMNFISAYLFSSIGEFDKANIHNQECLAQFQELNIMWGIGSSLVQRGHLANQSGDIELARKCFEQVLEETRRENSKRGMAMALNSLGELARITGNYELSTHFYNESMQLHQEMGNNMAVAMMLGNLGEVALHEKDYPRAKCLFNQTLEMARQLENPRIFLGCLEGFARVAAYAGRYKQAALLFGSAQESHEASGIIRDPADEMEYNLCIEYAREHLDPATFNSAWAEGKKMSVNEAIEFAVRIMEEI
jgi:tetratricopeptide (TPR) repeat protein